MLLVAVIAKQRVAGLIVFIVILLHASQLRDLYIPVKPVQTDQSIRLMSSNLLASNVSHEAILAQISQIDPDVILFQEYTSQWHRILNDALTEYPHRVVYTLDSPFGIAAYSRLPIVEGQVDSIASFPVVDIKVQLAQVPVRILGVHPIPPMSDRTYNSRNEYLNSVAMESRLYDGPMAVAGDFNAVPWSWHFKKMLDDGKLKSARDGFGLKPTWPGNFVPLWIPIDHILHNSHLSVIDFDTGKSAGSDHKPIWVDLSLL